MEAQVSTLIKRAKEFARYKGVPFSKWQEDMGLSNSHFYNCRSLTKKVYDLIESRYPELDMIWLMTGKGNMLKGQKLPQDIESHYVPMLPISSLGTFDLTEDYDNCERVISPLKNIDFVLQVIGDSMTPEYSNGSKVYVSKINDASFIEWGCTYVLNTSNGIIMKNIFPCQTDNDKVVCRSSNPNYAPYEIAISDIKSWYRVRAVLTLK